MKPIINKYWILKKYLLLTILAHLCASSFSQTVDNSEIINNYLNNNWIGNDNALLPPEIVLMNNNTNSNASLVLDSVLEIRSLDLYTDIIHWFYTYSDDGKIKKIEGKFHNEENEFMDIIEERTFNTDGQLVEFKRRDASYYLTRDITIDSLLLQSSKVVYTYNNKLLSKKVTSELEWNGWQSYTEEYQYNEKENIILYSKKVDNKIYTNKYYYNDNDLLEYIVKKEDYTVQVFNYNYTQTDTSRSLIIKNNYFGHIVPRLDTITVWANKTDNYLEKFDQFARRVEFNYTQADFYDNSDLKRLRITHTYTETGKLQHVTFFTQHSTGYGGSGIHAETEEEELFETTRIDNTYDNDDHLIKYEKTYYNALWEQWEVCESKTYYYSNHVVAIAENQNSIRKIFPNPADNFITIPKEYVGKNYSIHNINGKLIKQGVCTEQSITIKDLNCGFYILHIKNQNFNYVGKFVKQ